MSARSGPQPTELWMYVGPDSSYVALVFVIGPIDLVTGAWRCHCMMSSVELDIPADHWYFDADTLPYWNRLA